MYIFAHVAEISPPTMLTDPCDTLESLTITSDLTSLIEPSMKKRKRVYDLEDSTQGYAFTSVPFLSTNYSDFDRRSSLSIFSAHYLFPTALPTPTASTTSFFSDTAHPGPTASQLTRVNSTGSSPPKSKRAHLTPISRTKSIPARSSSGTTNDSFTPNLHPCHLCHRRPTTVQDLPTYAYCESCQLRTCFVCLRICEGPRCRLHTSNQMDDTSDEIDAVKGRSVCRKCCVEVGVDGTVWCLVCYEDDAEEETYSMGPTKKEMQTERVHRVADWLQDCGGEED